MAADPRTNRAASKSRDRFAYKSRDSFAYTGTDLSTITFSSKTRCGQDHNSQKHHFINDRHLQTNLKKDLGVNPVGSLRGGVFACPIHISEPKFRLHPIFLVHKFYHRRGCIVQILELGSEIGNAIDGFQSILLHVAFVPCESEQIS